MHPRGLRCSSLKYSRYSRSSRLARGAPRPSRCDASLSPRAVGRNFPSAARCDEIGRRLLKNQGDGCRPLSRGPGRTGITPLMDQFYQPVLNVWLHSGPPTRLPRWGPRSTGDASPPPHRAEKRAAGAPARGLRCSSFKYSRYSQSSRLPPQRAQNARRGPRLARGAPRPSRCSARLSPRAARPRRP